MIRCCINGYNEIFLLESCLQKIRSKVDHITFVDGAYKEFPHKIPWSNDGTLDIAKELCDEVIECTEPWPDEIIKRNQYLTGAPGDWYFVLDCDEMFVGDIRESALETLTDDVDIRMREKHDSGYIPDRNIYRFFKHREGIHYEKTHHALWLPGIDLPLNKREHDVYPHAYLEHLTKQRPIERNECKGVYIRWLQKQERVARHEYWL